MRPLSTARPLHPVNLAVLDGQHILYLDVIESSHTFRFASEVGARLELALETEPVYGARMTGGDFGGCTVNLVAAKAVAEFQRKLVVTYHAKVGVVPEICASTPSQGVGRVPEPQ